MLRPVSNANNANNAMMMGALRADEWLVDISGVAREPASPLSSVPTVRALCDDVVGAFRLTLVAPALCHRFPGPGHGVTALYLLSESHLALHTWPERGGALMSLGTCRPGVPESFSWESVVRRHFGADAVVVVTRVQRAIAADGSAP